jgi:hypothetical protein
MGLKFIAGDFPVDAQVIYNPKTQKLGYHPKPTWSNLQIRPTEILTGNIATVEQVTDENKKNFVGAAGWGLVGAVALGPLGLLAGVLAGGNRKEVCFACTLKDGRRFLAIADSATYQRFLAETF